VLPHENYLVSRILLVIRIARFYIFCDSLRLHSIARGGREEFRMRRRHRIHANLDRFTNLLQDLVSDTAMPRLLIKHSQCFPFGALALRCLANTAFGSTHDVKHVYDPEPCTAVIKEEQLTRPLQSPGKTYIKRVLSPL